MHMSFSGIDYFGADVGGFHREALDGDLNELYQQWLADAAAFDVPVRPHTFNLARNNETAPDRVGDFKSNLANIRRRYELGPYYYSLAFGRISSASRWWLHWFTIIRMRLRIGRTSTCGRSEMRNSSAGIFSSVSSHSTGKTPGKSTCRPGRLVRLPHESEVLELGYDP